MHLLGWFFSKGWCIGGFISIMINHPAPVQCKGQVWWPRSIWVNSWRCARHSSYKSIRYGERGEALSDKLTFPGFYCGNHNGGRWTQFRKCAAAIIVIFMENRKECRLPARLMWRLLYKDRYKDTHKDRYKDRHKDRNKYRHRDRQRQTETDRDRQRQTQRQTDTDTPRKAENQLFQSWLNFQKVEGSTWRS